MGMKGFKRALLGAATVASLCGVAFPASGQEAVIAACQALPTEAERFDCLADALRLANGQATLTADDVDAAAAAAPTSATSPAAPGVAAAEPRRGGLRVPFFGGRDESEPAVATASAVDPDSFGAEQVMSSRDAGAAPVMNAAVVSSDVVGYMQLEVELDNGQVWRQAQSEKPWDPILDDVPDTVEIRASRFGGYRMLLVEENRSLMVERIR